MLLREIGFSSLFRFMNYPARPNDSHNHRISSFACFFSQFSGCITAVGMKADFTA
jgi:hypothetical protein